MEADEESEEALKQIAAASTRLLQGSEADFSCFENLLQFSTSHVLQVARLSILSLAAVFCDLLPGYNLRDIETANSQQRISSGVQKVLDAERTLLGFYRRYTAVLDTHARKNSPAILKRASITAKCQLLQKAASSSAANPLLQAIVECLAGPEEDIAQMCVAALSQAMQGDREGGLTRQIVQLVADLVRLHHCRCRALTLSLLLDVNTHLLGPAHPVKTTPKLTRLGKHRGKRKGTQKQSQLAVKGVVSAIAEAIFEVYFRVLKHATSDTDQPGTPMSEPRAMQRFPLLFAALEGILRHAQMMGVDYHEDALKVLLKVAALPSLPLRMRLASLCVAATAYQSRGELTTLDRSPLFICFKELLPLCSLKPLLQETSGGQALSFPSHLAGTRTDVGSLLSFLVKRMFTRADQNVEFSLLVAVAKQLVPLALQMEYSSSALILQSCQQALRQNKRLQSSFLEGGSRQCSKWGASGGTDFTKLWAGLVEEDQSPLWMLHLFQKHADQSCSTLAQGLIP